MSLWSEEFRGLQRDERRQEEDESPEARSEKTGLSTLFSSQNRPHDQSNDQSKKKTEEVSPEGKFFPEAFRLEGRGDDPDHDQRRNKSGYCTDIRALSKKRAGQGKGDESLDEDDRTDDRGKHNPLEAGLPADRPGDHFGRQEGEKKADRPDDEQSGQSHRAKELERNAQGTGGFFSVLEKGEGKGQCGRRPDYPNEHRFKTCSEKP